MTALHRTKCVETLALTKYVKMLTSENMHEKQSVPSIIYTKYFHPFIYTC